MLITAKQSRAASEITSSDSSAHISSTTARHLCLLEATLDSTINPSGNGTSSNKSDSQQAGLPHTGDDSSKIAILGIASLLATIPLIGLDLQSKSKDFQ